MVKLWYIKVWINSALVGVNSLDFILGLNSQDLFLLQYKYPIHLDDLRICWKEVLPFFGWYHCNDFAIFQEIDDLLSGGLTDQDESDVLAELDEIIGVSSTDKV